MITDIVRLDEFLITSIVDSRTHFLILRLGLVIGILSLSLLRSKSFSQTAVPLVLIHLPLTFFGIVLFLYGYTEYFYYNIIVYPVVFAALFLLTPKSVRSLNLSLIPVNKELQEVSKKKGEFSFVYPTEKGNLYVHDVRTAIFIEGSAKAGKTASIISALHELRRN